MKRFNAKESWKHAREQMPKPKEKICNIIKTARKYRQRDKSVSPKSLHRILIISIITMVLVVAVLGKLNPGSITFYELVLVAGLIAVTTVYAYSAIQMADEMRKQRHDALRPIIDIVKQPIMDTEKFEQGLNAEKGNLPKDLLCKLRNVGVGPALELYSFTEDIEDTEGNPRQEDLGVLPVAIGTRMTATGEEEIGYTDEMRLLLQQRGNHRVLVAYYKDLYGNLFESIREVSVNKGIRRVNIGPLKVRPLPKRGQ